MKYDVVVVGAGPAGAVASKYAAKNGARTLLIEEHASIGSPVQCTGLISTAALAECEIGEGSFVLARMKGAFVYAPDGEELTVRGKGIKAYVIDRKMFDRALIERSLDEGVEILLKTRFTDIHGDKISVISSGERKDIQADIIIGADGIQSSVGRAVGLPRCEKFLSGIQFEAPYAASDPGSVEIFTGNNIAPGFLPGLCLSAIWRALGWLRTLIAFLYSTILKNCWNILSSPQGTGVRVQSMWSEASLWARRIEL